MWRKIAIGALLLLAIPSFLWLTLYFRAMWPHVQMAIQDREPAMIYDPYFKIADIYDPATDTFSYSVIIPFSFADGPTGIECTSFAMPCWPITIVAAGISMISIGYFIFPNRKEITTPVPTEIE